MSYDTKQDQNPDTNDQFHNWSNNCESLFGFLEQEKNSDKVLEGTVEIGSQYHNYMETHTHIIRPIENGEFEVYPATQWPHSIHFFLSNVLKIPSHKFDVRVIRRHPCYLISLKKCMYYSP